ncbi:MAG: alkaline phosphatase family protein [Oscillospiraceae bacterium]|jgi:predicted AlkP superfamily pyrophosphatase or phosphodiesterase|nr:alkaline phosphatase family protein [Oscillospiraceae bacterium]
MYKRVAILGVDGMGAFNARTDTPRMDELFAGGAVTCEALTSIPTISAECWGSMLLGVGPKTHGLTNSIASSQPYDVNAPCPSVFRVARAAMPGARLASFSNWNPINTGIIEENLGVHKETGNDDAEVCEKILAYLDANAPTLLFVQFDEVDGAGHKFGYGARMFRDKITEAGALIGRVGAKYRERGYFEDTLFIVSADHGGNRRHGHGGRSKNEKRIFIGCAGKTVKPGAIEKMNVRDIAAVAAAALGLEAPGAWTAKVPEGVFQ